MIGTRVGKYTITQEIGDGGHAFVFKGDGPNGEAVAIKMLKPSVAGEDNLDKRFVLEADALKKLKHPHIVDFHDYIFKDGYHYLVLELMDQGSVEDLIKTMGAVAPRYAVPIFYHVLDAIDFSHNHGYIHRDLKPNNILINSEGKAKLTDFGITKVVGGQNLTRKGFVLGTTLYMAPEFISQGVVSIKTDVYALGVTFYEMLTSHKPFEYEREDEPLRDFALRVCQGKATPPTAYKPLPPQLERIVMKSLAQNPKDRYKSAKEFRRDLARNFPDLINRDIVIPSGRAMTRYVKIDDLKDVGATLPSVNDGAGGMAPAIRGGIAATALIICLALSHFAPTLFADQLGHVSKGLLYGLGGGAGLLIAGLLFMLLPRPRQYGRVAAAAAEAQPGPTKHHDESSSSGGGYESEDSSIPEFEDTIPFADQFRSNKPVKMTENSELNAYLVVISGPDKGRRFGLRPVSRIGRDLRLDIRPHDPEISRHHTTITFDGRGFTVEDLNSTNGTFLNEERMYGKRPLKPGDIIRTGSSSMRFEFQGEVA